MRYIRVKYETTEGIFDIEKTFYDAKLVHMKENEIPNVNNYAGWYWVDEYDGYDLACRDIDVSKEADTIEELIQIGDIVFYFDYHSQKEQCLYVNDLMFIKNMNITKLLIPFGDDYKCAAKATHTYLEIDNMKQVVKKGELKVL